ncbi:MAG: S1 family peptidase [Nocardioidaceae bacterium]
MSTSPTIRRGLLGVGAIAATGALIAGSAASVQARPDDGRLQTIAEQSRSASMAAERRDDKLADRLTRELGDRHTAGAYIEAGSGDLVVTVTDATAASEVRQTSATPQRVTHAAAQLGQVHQALDNFAQRSGAGAVQGWYVDVPTNSVVVTVSADATGEQTRQFLAQARSYGDRVEVERTTADAVPAEFLYGGQQVNMSNGFICSNGFNTRTSSGAYVLLTAGHCAEGFPTFSRNGVTIGATRGYSFPGNDYASVNINDPAYWNPQGAVDMYNGFARVVSGHSKAVVGSSLCKSGRTTGWTCGTIQAYNQTVNYGGGDIVRGLVRHSACVEQGDSGGSNMSGNLAQGLSSGGQLYQSGGRLVCGERVGQPNVSFYQPVGEALNAYGLSLITQ